MRVFTVLLTASMLFFTARAAQSAQVRRSYVYYPISAASQNEMIAALRKQGPYVAEVKQRHPAAVAIEFKNSGKPRQNGKYCSFDRPAVTVIAKIYLPRWQRRGKEQNAALTRFWDKIYADMRRHEARHIDIAHTYAMRMEEELRALPARRGCAELRADADKTIQRLSQNNAAAQLEFDKKEAKRVTDALKKLRQDSAGK